MLQYRQMLASITINIIGKCLKKIRMAAYMCDNSHIYYDENLIVV